MRTHCWQLVAPKLLAYVPESWPQPGQLSQARTKPGRRNAYAERAEALALHRTERAGGAVHSQHQRLAKVLHQAKGMIR